MSETPPGGGVAAYLRGLNPQQRQATEHFEGPILVLAGAGSGKTRVLTTRICHLVQEHGVPPGRILAVTFTNKAAGEMRERVARMLGGEPAGLWIGTFHAVGARILRRHADRLAWGRTFAIFDQEQSLRLVKKVQEQVGLDPKRWSPKGLRAEISRAKNDLVTPQAFAAEHEKSFDMLARAVARVFPSYQEALREQNAFDFDDLLQKPVELFEAHPAVLAGYRERFAFILVDEYQDTNRAQFRFLELLAREHANLMVVGDDDQSIYGWRGADIRNILDFERTFPGARVVRLERNYRSTSKILGAANAVIAENVNRRGKTLHTEREDGEPITLVECLDEADEARWIVGDLKARFDTDRRLTYRSFAVLYRTNAQARALEDAFRREGIPYQVVGSMRFYERREIQDVLAYLRLISNPRDAVAFERVVNYPRRGVGDASRARLAAWASREGLSLLQAAARAEEVPDLPAASARALEGFAALVQRYSARAARGRVGTLLADLVEELDLVRHLEAEGPEGEDRARNVAELVAGALDFDAALLDAMGSEEVDGFTEVDLFLQQVALVADVDRLDTNADAAVLMTLHNAKGLEFPVVYIAGLEEGLFPLARAYDEPEALEEERRLFYVGITRAQDKLILTWARQRRRAGDVSPGTLSSFVDAIPPGVREERRSERLRIAAATMPILGRRRRGLLAGLMESYDTDPDAALDQDTPRYIKGERVIHATFGSGSVVEVSGFGRDMKVTVDFDEVGLKRLLVRYANLQKDWL